MYNYICGNSFNLTQDWTTNGTMNPVVESGSFWVVSLWEMTCVATWVERVVGRYPHWDVCRIGSLLVLLPRNTWHETGRGYAWLLLGVDLCLDSDPVESLTMLLD